MHNIYAQNGIYQSHKYEFISENEPSRNRVEYTTNRLVFQINHIGGEFIGGRVLWEMQSNGQSEWWEMELISIKNSFFDDNNSAFIKVYRANIKSLDQIISQEDIYIWRFVNDNTYRLDMRNPRRKTVVIFDDIKKL